VCRVFAGGQRAFAISEAGEVFSSGSGMYGLLGHGDTRDQPSPKRVAALLYFRVSTIAI
jgi:alpha-tubulin suppressor-like RCC1 family protein